MSFYQWLLLPAMLAILDTQVLSIFRSYLPARKIEKMKPTDAIKGKIQ
ncbi:MAG: hypothetical protein ACMUHX_06630 [bacterium]